MQRIFIENADEQLFRSINSAFEEADIDYDIDAATEILDNLRLLGHIKEFNWEVI